jgi:hypothetical protein
MGLNRFIGLVVVLFTPIHLFQIERLKDPAMLCLSDRR